MRGTLSLRALAMAVLLLIMMQPFGVLAEQVEDQSFVAEAPAVEAGDLALTGEEPADESAESDDTPLPPPEDIIEDEEEDEVEGEEVPSMLNCIESGPDEKGRVNRVFDSMVEVDSASWSSLNLKRESGYSGKLAYIRTRLSLDDILIEGNPAGSVNLLDYFDLAPNACITCQAGQQGLGISLSAFSINKSASKTLSLTCEGHDLPSKKAKWTTTNKKVASVSSKGKVSARGKGTAIITAKYGDALAVCSVQVTHIVFARKVSLNMKSMEVALGCVDDSLKAAVSPANADFKEVEWLSSAPDIASVDSEGRITGLSAGVATITARLLSNGKTASCKVTVKEIKPQSIDLSRTYLTMSPGDSFQMEVAFTPRNVTFPDYSIASDDDSVVTVDEGGVVTAVGVGKAVITVVSDRYPAVKNTCRICVLEEGSGRLAGLTIGINPGHQKKTIKEKYPIAPGSSKMAYGVKTGACGKYTRVNEYETTLQIGLKLKRILEEQGAKVVITRTTNDVMLTNIDRAQMLNEANVDIALQLHCNSVSSSSKHGNSGYIRTTGDWVEESRAMAACITSAISRVCGCANLGVKVKNDYMSLNWTTTPSVLLEMGYISNRTEDKLLATDEYREKMALGISEGIADYFGR